MARIIKEIILDPRNDEIQGWEFEKSPLKVLEYIDMNLRGYVPPRFGVVKKNGVYQLSYSTDGGHRRTLAHEITGHLLYCNLMNRHFNPWEARGTLFKRIQDIRLEPLPNGGDFNILNYDCLNLDVNNFTPEIIERFVSYYKLIPEKGKRNLSEHLWNEIERMKDY